MVLDTLADAVVEPPVAAIVFQCGVLRYCCFCLAVVPPLRPRLPLMAYWAAKRATLLLPVPSSAPPLPPPMPLPLPASSLSSGVDAKVMAP